MNTTVFHYLAITVPSSSRRWLPGLFSGVGPTITSFISFRYFSLWFLCHVCALIVLLCPAVNQLNKLRGLTMVSQKFQGQQFGQAQQQFKTNSLLSLDSKGNNNGTKPTIWSSAKPAANSLSQPVNQEQPFAQQQPVQNPEFGQLQHWANQVNQPTQPF